MRWLRALYEWVLAWAETPYGPAALFLLAVAESVIFPVPPDVLLIALALGSREKSIRFGVICSAGSILGGIAGYGLGHLAWLAPGGFTPLAEFFFDTVPGFNQELYFQIGERFAEWGFVIVFTAGFTPVPYKLFTVSAGAFDIPFLLFLLASAVSRSARFLLVAGLIYRFGEPIRRFLDRYFNALAVLFAALLIAGFLVVRFWL